MGNFFKLTKWVKCEYKVTMFALRSICFYVTIMPPCSRAAQESVFFPPKPSEPFYIHVLTIYILYKVG